MAKSTRLKTQSQMPDPGYGTLIAGISDLLDHALRSAARAVNGILTATYWEVGRRIVEVEQGGEAADAGLLPRLGDSADTVCRIRGSGHYPVAIDALGRPDNETGTVIANRCRLI